MRRFLERLIPFLGVAVFAVALGVLYRVLSDDTWSAAREGFAAVSPGPVALAVLLTAASFFVLGPLGTRRSSTPSGSPGTWHAPGVSRSPASSRASGP